MACEVEIIFSLAFYRQLANSCTGILYRYVHSHNLMRMTKCVQTHGWTGTLGRTKKHT